MTRGAFAKTAGGNHNTGRCMRDQIGGRSSPGPPSVLPPRSMGSGTPPGNSLSLILHASSLTMEITSFFGPLASTIVIKASAAPLPEAIMHWFGSRLNEYEPLMPWFRALATVWWKRRACRQLSGSQRGVRRSTLCERSGNQEEVGDSVLSHHRLAIDHGRAQPEGTKLGGDPVGTRVGPLMARKRYNKLRAAHPRNSLRYRVTLTRPASRRARPLPAAPGRAVRALHG
ncbi:hypothetical protein SAMN05444161_8380 [Rhizobiales bacterium GAS191]|nr:hypothetical protein SAMN05444161_8380 [Rhizobiales bacterium GAS191]